MRGVDEVLVYTGDGGEIEGRGGEDLFHVVVDAGPDGAQVLGLDPGDELGCGGSEGGGGGDEGVAPGEYIGVYDCTDD